MLSKLKAARRALSGTAFAREGLAASTAALADNTAALTALRASLPADYRFSDESPIFLLSAGWRSGSTMLQRMVCGDNVLIWGEPYDRSNVVQSLAAMVGAFSANWPAPEYYVAQYDLTQRNSTWIANLYPMPADYVNGLYALFEATFVAPARERGFQRWGIKEVRFGGNEARLLKFLYPDARFLYLKRDLTDAYLSYKSFNPGMDWYDIWPTRPVFTPYAFACHWARLVREYHAAIAETGGHLIEYEKLVGGTVDLKQINAYCGTELAASALEQRVGETRSRNPDGASRLSWLERHMLRAGASRGARPVGA